MDKILYPSQLKYLSQFKNPNDTLVIEMEKYAIEHHIPILDWQSAALMEILIKIVKPKTGSGNRDCYRILINKNCQEPKEKGDCTYN